MTRIQALILAIAVGVAVVAGALATFKTTQLSSRATTPTVSPVQIARQNRVLDRAEAALRAELRKRPPHVAALPAAVPAAPQTVVYRRAPTIVHVTHRAGADREAEGGEARDD